MRITLEDIFNIPNAVIYYPDLYKSVTSVSIDTRTIKKNSLFVAIKGKNYDGHRYVNEAIKKGATAIVVSNRKLMELDDIEILIISVKNTTHAYGELAKIWRNKQKAKVISITGSNGKTSTKEMLALLLSSKYKVHKTEANNNNQIGVPLTILSASKDTDFIVLEHGSNHFGEIDYTAKIAQPDYALITNIGSSHTQYLESKEKILNEKVDLFNNLKETGIVFINTDDTLLKSLKNNFSNKLTYGFKGKPEIKGKVIGKSDDSRERLLIVSKKTELEITNPLIGESNSANYLAAVAISIKLGLPKKEIIKATKSIKSFKGRLQEKDYDNYTLIDDTYNSNPESVKNALNVLRRFKLRRNKVLIFGDMLELGKLSMQIHRELANEINKLKIDIVLTIGKHSAEITSNINSATKIKKHFHSRALLKKYLKKIELIDSVILVKGSRGMKMEEFIKVLENRVN